MKIVGYVLGAGVVLAIVRAIAAALIILLVIAIIVGVVAKPRETFGLFIFFIIGSLIQNHGIAILCIGFAIIAFGTHKRRDR